MSQAKSHLEPAAFRMYVHNATLAEISRTLSVSETSLSKWKTKYDWDSRKEIELQSTQYSVTKLKKMLADYIKSVDSLAADEKFGDKISKVTASIERLDSHFDFLGSVLKVSEEWITWAAQNDEELFKALQRALPHFLAHARGKFNR